jgi:hypothetical protein
MRQAVPLLASCALVAGCASTTHGGEFTGRYEAGFERSAFTPCGSTDTWWVVFDSTTDLDREVVPQLARLDGRPDGLLGTAMTFARFRGDTSAVGTYGHLGQQRRRLYVTKVLTLRRLAPDDCAPSGSAGHSEGAI